MAIEYKKDGDNNAFHKKLKQVVSASNNGDVHVIVHPFFSEKDPDVTNDVLKNERKLATIIKGDVGGNQPVIVLEQRSRVEKTLKLAAENDLVFVIATDFENPVPHVSSIEHNDSGEHNNASWRRLGAMLTDAGVNSFEISGESLMIVDLQDEIIHTACVGEAYTRLRAVFGDKNSRFSDLVVEY